MISGNNPINDQKIKQIAYMHDKIRNKSCYEMMMYVSLRLLKIEVARR